MSVEVGEFIINESRLLFGFIDLGDLHRRARRHWRRRLAKGGPRRVYLPIISSLFAESTRLISSFPLISLRRRVRAWVIAPISTLASIAIRTAASISPISIVPSSLLIRARTRSIPIMASGRRRYRIVRPRSSRRDWSAIGLATRILLPL